MKTAVKQSRAKSQNYYLLLQSSIHALSKCMLVKVLSHRVRRRTHRAVPGSIRCERSFKPLTIVCSVCIVLIHVLGRQNGVCVCVCACHVV